MNKNLPPSISSEISFEDALAKLEKLVKKMEEGKLPLEDMMKTFEEASKLADICSAKLKEVESKIEVLINKNNKKQEWTLFEEDKEKENN